MAIEVPFFGLKRESETLRSELLEGVAAVLDHGQVLQSREVLDFETSIAKMTGRKYATATGSCTDSLYFALLAAGVSRFDEVVVPAFSYIASASCILRIGATPVFVDVDINGNMDANKVSAVLSERTKALIYVHMYGHFDEQNLSLIKAQAEKFEVTIIEDCAQAFGSIGGVSGVPAGSLGSIACISFDPTKVISALGSGGVLLTDDENDAILSKKLRYHGKGPEGKFDLLGFNSQMPTITASALLIKLKYDEKWRVKRQKIAKIYIENLKRFPVRLPEVQKIETHNYHKFVINLDQREEALEWLLSSGIQAMVHYREPLPQHKIFDCCSPKNNEFERAQKLSHTCLSLPCHAFLSELEIDYVIEKMEEFFRL